MTAFWGHFQISLRLALRNPMGLIYGYAFPLIFLAAFWVLYSHESIPLLGHFGALLTVSALGGACFGLPTTLVSERELGVWRRFKLVPPPIWLFVASTAAIRYLLVLSAGLLQLVVAIALGMTPPIDLFALWIAFTCVTFSFIGLGLLLAMLADNVSAVQALGQCIFLPMLIIGGIAVPLTALPEWALHVSAFFPGRYAVDALQAAVTGNGWCDSPFPLIALMIMGAASAFTSIVLFRWDAGQKFLICGRRRWVIILAGTWLTVGIIAEWPKPAAHSEVDSAASTAASPLPLRAPWQTLTQAETDALNYNVPPDDSVVTPYAAYGEDPPDYIRDEIDSIRDKLPTWVPAQDPDMLRAVRNLLYVPAAADLMQLSSERYLPPMVFTYLTTNFPQEELIQALTWIALHPDEGGMPQNLSALGLPDRIGSHHQLSERVNGYAIKFVGRLRGRLGSPSLKRQ